MKKIISALLIVMFSATVACAQSYGYNRYRPWYPPRRHSSDNSSAIAAGVGGLILGAILAGALNSNSNSSSNNNNGNNNDGQYYNNSISEEQRYEMEKEAKDFAASQRDYFISSIESVGVEQAIRDVDSYWRSQGNNTKIDSNKSATRVTVTDNQNGYSLTYAADRSTCHVAVAVENNTYKISATSNGMYNSKANNYYPSSSSGVPAPSYNNYGNGSAHIMGFTVSDNNRTKDGYMIISNIRGGTAAAYVGVTNNAVLYKVDGYKTNEASAEQLRSYIEGRIKSDMTVTINFSAGDSSKTATIRP